MFTRLCSSPISLHIFIFVLLLLSFSWIWTLTWSNYQTVAVMLSENLSNPPSVILSPVDNYCAEHRYLVVVLTRVSEADVRQSFRETYGRFSAQYNFTIIFPLGISEDQQINVEVREEFQRRGDILQTNFIDSYRNLTLKTYSYSNYIRQNCTNVSAVLKVDDDLAWNVPMMFKYLSEIDPNGNILYCRSVKNPLVQRNRTEKWYVSETEYPYKYFPEYCLSPVYAATPTTISALCEATNTIPHLWLDDVWSLGLVAKEIAASFRPLSFNVEREIFEPFLNGSVITQYFRRRQDGLYLFHTVNEKLKL